MNRRGVVMVTVLWTIAVMGVSVGAGLVSIRVAIRASENRTRGIQEYWLAESCLATFRAEFASQVPITGRDFLRASAVPPRVGSACRFRVEPVEWPLNVNVVGVSALGRIPELAPFAQAIVTAAQSEPQIETFSRLLQLMPPESAEGMRSLTPYILRQVSFGAPLIRVGPLPVLANRRDPAIEETWVFASGRVAVVDRVVR